MNIVTIHSEPRSKITAFIIAAFAICVLAAFAGLQVVAGIAGGAAAAYAFIWVTSRSRATPPNLSAAPAIRQRVTAIKDDGPKDLVEEMLTQDRQALLLRPQVVANLTPQQHGLARDSLREAMALSPLGPVNIQSSVVPGLEDDGNSSVYQIDSFLLDRHLVTNRQFQNFVTAGGYEQLALWDRAVLPAVLDFVDSTGQPGPRYWANGVYPSGKADHPVVGVSWHEAAAYSRWVGKRLPTNAEWVKAAAWPTAVSATQCSQRRYPWGDTMERGRANVWGDGPDDTVAVTQYEAGMSVGGVHQLIGNVWEWTTDDFVFDEGPRESRTRNPVMKSIRGGAYNTYFDSHTTCQFRSGENPLSRKNNLGFRCAVSLCDLALTVPDSECSDSVETEAETVAIAGDG